MCLLFFVKVNATTVSVRFIATFCCGKVANYLKVTGGHRNTILLDLFPDLLYIIVVF